MAAEHPSLTDAPDKATKRIQNKN